MNLMHLLLRISVKHLRYQKTQVFLAVSGICLGVAAMVAIELVNRSVLQSFEDSINHATGRAAFQVTGAESGFPEEMLDRIRLIPGIEYAVPVIETTGGLRGKSDRALMVLGIDVLLDHHIRDYSLKDESADIPDPLLFLAKRDSILLTRAMAAEVGVGVDQEIVVQTVEGLKTFKVRGLLNPEGPAKVAGGDIAIMDVYAAQMAFGKEGRIDRVDVSLLPGENFNTVKERIRQALPEGYEVDTPAGRTRQVEILLGRFRNSMGIISFMALFVGMYLIYNTVSIAVVQRRREVGILRALGAGRGQIAGLFLAEALVTALVASLLGFGLGLLFARASIGMVAQSVTEMYVKASVDEVVFSWGALGKSLGAGVLASLAAAAFPALAAARVSPVAAIRARPFTVDGVLQGRLVKTASLACLLASMLGLALFEALPLASPVKGIGLVSVVALLLLAGATLATPGFLARILPWAHGPLSFCFGAEGRLAGLNLRKNVTRNSVAVAAILCGIALFVSSANAVSSLRISLFEWFDSIIRADILVSSGHPLATGGSPTIPMPAAMQAEIAKIPGVKTVEPFRKGRVSYKDRKILLEVFDVALRMEYCPAMIAKGSREDMAAKLPGQDNVVVNEGLAARERLTPGDSIELPTPAGPKRFGIAAVVVSYTSDSGVVWMDVNTYRRNFGDNLVDTYEVLLTPGAKLETVRQDILARFKDERQLFALSGAAFKEEIRKMLDRSFVMTNAVNVITLLVAGLGVIVTLLASVLERTREIGILRGIGMQRSQVSAVVIIESALLGAVGGGLGAAVGLVIGWVMMEGVFRLDFGASIGYHVHYPALFGVLALSVAFSALAGLYPARRAAATNIVEALAYE